MATNADASTGQVGYWLAPAARGRGVKRAALQRFCQYALEEVGVQRLELVTDPDNVASQRVAEAAGFMREGRLRSHIVHPDGRRLPRPTMPRPLIVLIRGLAGYGGEWDPVAQRLEVRAPDLRGTAPGFGIPTRRT